MSMRMKLVNTIEINAPKSVVFDYVANIRNDPKWRSEVDRMDVQGPIQVGTLAVEYSTLFRPFVKTVTPTRITVLDHPNTVTFETDDGVEPWLMSHRSVKSLSDDKTQLTYRLETDLPGSGFIGRVYEKLMTKIYGPRLPRYLNELKNKIETGLVTAESNK